MSGQASNTTRKVTGRKWARDFKQCRQCKTVDRVHVAKGLCSACYARRRDRPSYKDTISMAADRLQREKQGKAIIEPKQIDDEPKDVEREWTGKGFKKGDLLSRIRIDNGLPVRETAQVLLECVDKLGDRVYAVQRLQFPFGLEYWPRVSCTRFGHMEVLAG